MKRHVKMNIEQKIFRMFVASIVFIMLSGFGTCFAGNWPAYISARGTLPQEQGWIFYDVNEPCSPAVVDGLLHQGLTTAVGIQGWADDSRILCFGSGDRFSISFQLKVIQSDYAVVDNQWDCGYKVWAYDDAGRFVCAGFSSDGVRLTISSDFSTSSSKSTAFYPFNTTNGFHSYSISVTHYDTWDEDRVSLGIDGQWYVVNTLYHLGDIDQGDYNVVGFGDASTSRCSETLLERFTFSVQNSFGLLGDDEITGLDDLQIFCEQWLRTDCGCNGFCEEADINQDGRVDVKDFCVIGKMWLKRRYY